MNEQPEELDVARDFAHLDFAEYDFSEDGVGAWSDPADLVDHWAANNFPMYAS